MAAAPSPPKLTSQNSNNTKRNKIKIEMFNNSSADLLKF
jgi:hypothetical protein